MIAVVCHDAGGAEIISSWLLSQKEKFILTIDGPAVRIFERKFGKLVLESLEKNIVQCNWLLCGTSWESDLEKKAIKFAKLKSKKNITFLDHWVNYKERFISDNIMILPDEIWVGDSKAYDIAKNEFPKTTISIFPNPYFQTIITEIKKREKCTEHNLNKSILYLCEPISDHLIKTNQKIDNLGYDEISAMNYFINHLDYIVGNYKDIVIRPHPSENKNKYNWVLQLNSKIRISTQSLVEDIANATIIVGCETVAMVVGILADKRVICAIPPGGNICRLPFTEIESLQKIITNNKF